ncbi:hypothetical protein EDD22DRAFT_958004 [Suillus occidentalis]|nr:hypothetical protein EDD22DRAFT_958004 [Suillus occidentalis]
MSVFSSNTQTQGRTGLQEPRRLVLKHGHKRVKVKRQRSYDLMLDSACKHFPSIPRDVITLQSNKLDDCDGRYVDITADVWDDVVDLLTIVRVTRRVEMTSPVTLPFDALAISSPDDQSGPSQVERRHNSHNNKISIKLVSPSGDIKTTQVSRDTRVDKFVAKACEISGGYPSLMPTFGTIVLNAKRSLRSYNIEDGDSINLPPMPHVKKPIIYLYSPSNIDVFVKLMLIPEWTLSVIYPVVATKDHGQHIEWNVRTHRDGSLTEYNSGLDVAYLFWEADYWLPSILKHEYIALRFISQAAYERAASLSISPQPDVVTRVFMLFKGIHKEHLANWANAQMQAEKDVGGWVDVVGVDRSDPARAGDATLFRVLEWGGMELPV